MAKVTFEEVNSKFECSGSGLIRKGKAQGRFIHGERPGWINKNTGARHIQIGGGNYAEHHLVWLLNTGEFSKFRLEHIDGDKQNNRFENLRQIEPEKKRVDQEFLTDTFEYSDGLLIYKKKWSPRSQYSVGDVFGYVDQEGYRRGKIQGKRYKHADLVWCFFNGDFPSNPLDHINRVRDDDRIENLREATPAENSRNRSIRSTNTSGVTGVVKRGKHWIARIHGEGGKQIHLGTFRTMAQARAARKAAEKLLGYIGE